MVNNKKLKQNETGLASFIVTLIMMIVISLIVLGFVQLTRREQRESLDNQLSTAAYYAAESGVNDAIQAINSGSFSGIKNTCPALPGVQYLDNSSVGNGASYTCLLINDLPNQLVFQDVATNESTMTPLQTSANPTSIKLTWKNVTGNTSTYSGCPSAGTFPSSWPAGSNCGAGILRIDLIPANALSNSSDLQDYTYTGFLVPRNGGPGSLSLPAQIVPPPPPPPTPPSKIPTNLNGVITSAKCLPATGSCSVSISNIDTSTTIWYLRMTSIYNDSNVTISAAPASLSFQKAQIDIDSTGKANDVLKRILVTVPYGGTINNTPFGLQTTDSVCKHFYITGPSVKPIDPGGIPGNPDISSCYGH